MAIVTLQNVHIGFDAQVVLDDLSWQIQRGEKVGLVGRNGSGKTTLFHLIHGDLKPHMGTVTRTRGLQVAYLPQEPELDSDRTVYEEVCETFSDLHLLEERVGRVAQEIADHHDADHVDELMEEYDELCLRLEAAGGYNYETTVREVLGGVGFTPDAYDLPISALSGGQKCRAALAKLLLQEADLLLLDEPTNHLDIHATRFVEKFLAGYHGAAIIVSHDRYLLDRVVTKIADLDQRKIETYPCSYSDFADAKERRQLTQIREFEKQQEWLKHQKEYAERVKADKSRSRQAKGRLKRVERMEKSGQVKEAPSGFHRKMALDFQPSRRAGDMVLRCEGVKKAYGDVVLFDGFDLEIARGEKVGIIGPNGVGKTTLIRMAMRQTEPDEGMVRLFENLDVGYYDQEHAELDGEGNHSILDEFMPHRTADEERSLRSYLGRFLFTGDDVFKRVGDLSGGERSRIMLAKLVHANPQVLILDEPTNHLDIAGKEVLEEALIAYEGAILLISHDRYFLDRVINRLVVLPERGKYEIMTGNWSTYEAKLAEEEARQREEVEARRAAEKAAKKGMRRKVKSPASGDAEDGKTSPYADWSLARLEDAIETHEQELGAVEHQFADPDIARDVERMKSLRAEAKRIRQELKDLNAEWELRAEAME